MTITKLLAAFPAQNAISRSSKEPIARQRQTNPFRQWSPAAVSLPVAGPARQLSWPGRYAQHHLWWRHLCSGCPACKPDWQLCLPMCTTKTPLSLLIYSSSNCPARPHLSRSHLYLALRHCCSSVGRELVEWLETNLLLLLLSVSFAHFHHLPPSSSPTHSSVCLSHG